MPTHIDHIVTEVIPEPEEKSTDSDGDKRWQELMKAEATIKRVERQYQRLKAGGFDD